MNFKERLEKADLARILKSKNLNTEKEWLEFYLFGHHFACEEGTYEHYRDKPKLELDFNFPDNIVCVKTDDCFFPKQFQQNPCFEIVILDTNKQLVLYYLLCIGQAGTVCPISHRVADYHYDELLHNVDLVILQHVSETTNLCIDHRNLYAGNVWYWHSIIRLFGEKGYPAYRLVAPDRATKPIDFKQSELMKPIDFRSVFIEKLASIKDFCFIIKEQV